MLRDSVITVSRCVKTSLQDRLDAMHFRGDVAGRDAGDLTNRRRVETFEIEEDDLPIEGPEAVNQPQQPVHGVALVDDGVRVLVGLCFEFVEADEGRYAGLPPQHL